MHICIVVLGDIGRSPRIQFHALSFARHDFFVDILGYAGARPHKLVMENALIRLRTMPEAPHSFRLLKSPLSLLLKLLWQAFFLFFLLLWCCERRSLILVQNPPGIPTMAVCWLVSVLKNALVICDWHNYTYTIMALQHGERSAAVRVARKMENYFGSKATAALCVSEAMRHDLLGWSPPIEAVTLHDRPSEVFQPVSLEEMHGLWSKLDFGRVSDDDQDVTKFTSKISIDNYCLLPHRPAVVMSSTSWTPDEDFAVLLSALSTYDTLADADSTLPRLLVVITGRGPQKEFYRQRVQELSLRNVQIHMPWLEAEDYPRLLASADLGVCLHASSSGLDLPMKVVDMFGCQLPVLAYRYNCIGELVKDGRNGFLFDSADSLLLCMTRCLRNFPHNETLLALKQCLNQQPLMHWNAHWDSIMWPLVVDLVASDQAH